MNGRSGYLMVVVCVAVMVLHCACGLNGVKVPSDPDTLAVYEGGSVSGQDLDGAILELPPAQRLIAPEQASVRNRAMVRLLVVNRILMEQAKADNVDRNPGFLEIHEENRQKLVADYFIESRRKSIPDVTPEDVRRYYEEHQAEISQPEKRLTSHIYRRVTDGIDRDAAVSELTGLRERILRGESFGTLAEQYSDSETALGLGELGWLARDSIPADLAGAVFSLEPGVPSDPVVTDDGVHLFMVTSTSAASNYGLTDVEPQVVAVLRSQRKQEFVNTLAESLPLPEPYFVPGADEVSLLVGSGDPQAVVFQIGETTLTVERFRQMIERSMASQRGDTPADLADLMLRALAQRARIYEHCRAQGLFDEPALASRLQRIHDQDILAFARERALVDEAREDSKALEGYFESNRRRFSSPLRLDVRTLVLQLPKTGAGVIMERLSRLAQDPSDDRLERAAAEFEGEVEHMAQVSLGQLMRWNPKAARIASTLEVGECSPPIRAGQTFVVIEVVSRWEPEPLPYSSVQDQVIRSYVEDHRQALYEQLAGRILDEAHFRVIEDRLEVLSLGEQQ